MRTSGDSGYYHYDGSEEPSLLVVLVEEFGFLHDCATLPLPLNRGNAAELFPRRFFIKQALFEDVTTRERAPKKWKL